jgi:hypothetical protein
MEPTQAGLFIALFVVIIAVAGVARVLWESVRQRAELPDLGERRAGAAERRDAEAVSAHAQGSTVWMRPDGGGF